MADPTPRERFDEEWPQIRRMVERSARAHGLHADEVENLTQNAGLILWEWCVKGRRIHGRYILLFAVRLHRKQRTGRTLPGCELPTVSLDDELPDGRTRGEFVTARSVSVRVDGVRFDLADARLEEPALAELVESGGVDARTLARQWGVSRQRVYQLAERIGAKKLGGQRFFPMLSRDQAAARVQATARAGVG